MSLQVNTLTFPAPNLFFDDYRFKVNSLAWIRHTKVFQSSIFHLQFWKSYSNFNKKVSYQVAILLVDADIHFTGFCGDDLSIQILLVQEHLTSVSFIDRNCWNVTVSLLKKREDLEECWSRDQSGWEPRWFEKFPVILQDPLSLLSKCYVSRTVDTFSVFMWEPVQGSYAGLTKKSVTPLGKKSNWKSHSGRSQ